MIAEIAEKWDNKENALALLQATESMATYHSGYRMIISKSLHGYIYLIHAIGTPRYKIGKTRREPSKRFLELNSSQSPYPLRLLTFYETDNIDYQEGRLHFLAKQYRMHGEWFEFPSWWLEKLDKWFYAKTSLSPPQKTWDTQLKIVDKKNSCSNKLGYGEVYALAINLILTNGQKDIDRLYSLLNRYIVLQGKEKRLVANEIKSKFSIDILSDSYAVAFKKTIKLVRKDLIEGKVLEESRVEKTESFLVDEQVQDCIDKCNKLAGVE